MSRERVPGILNGCVELTLLVMPNNASNLIFITMHQVDVNNIFSYIFPVHLCIL